MAWAEFEEKSFETSLYQQLRVEQGLVWSPGQVLEGHIGFDYAAVSTDAYLWSLHGLAAPPTGFWLEEMFLRRAWERRLIKTALPDFSLNLFLQAKRPYYKKYAAKTLKSAGLKAPYWKMSITPHQQSLLETLAQKAKSTALVCYASPAFHEAAQLYGHTKSGTIVQNTSFPKVTILASHSAWHYDAPGKGGFANPNPVFLEVPQLDAQIRSVRQEERPRSRKFDDNLRELAGAVMSSVSIDERGSTKGTVFFQRVADVDFRLQGLEDNQRRTQIREYLLVQAFCQTFGLLWMVAT
jgi:hypothetical protein